MPIDHETLMREAVWEAEKGESEGGIPIGAVLARDEEIIGRGHNLRVQDGDPLAHAEIVCLRSAGRIGSYRDTTLYSTLMPCYLCAGAVIQFGIPRVVVGESKNFEGARELLTSMGIELIDLDLDICRDMMSQFIGENPALWDEDIGGL